MRDRRKTIESLRRLAERPGTKAEGETARALLEKMNGIFVPIKPFIASEWPRKTKVYYNCWCYPINDLCEIVGKEAKAADGRMWLRMRFDHLKQPRWVPVTSEKGLHISKTPIPTKEADYLSDGMATIGNLASVYERH